MKDVINYKISDVFEKHPFYIYQQKFCLYGVAMNLLRFSTHYFLKTTIYKHRDYYKCIKAGEQPPINPQLRELLSDSLIDLVMMTIFIENYLKAHYLLNGYVVHEIDKGAHPHLQKEQKAGPFPESKLHELGIKKIKIPEGEFDSYPGLKPTTISVNTLLGYVELNLTDTGIDDELLDYFRSVLKQRNALHLLDKQTLALHERSYVLMSKIADVINTYLVPQHNKLSEVFKNDKRYDLHPVIM